MTYTALLEQTAQKVFLLGELLQNRLTLILTSAAASRRSIAGRSTNSYCWNLQARLKGFVPPDDLKHGKDPNNKWRTVSCLQKAIRPRPQSPRGVASSLTLKVRRGACSPILSSTGTRAASISTRPSARSAPRVRRRFASRSTTPRSSVGAIMRPASGHCWQNSGPRSPPECRRAVLRADRALKERIRKSKPAREQRLEST